MADLIVTQDPTNPGVSKVNGPPITNGKVPLSSLATTGANANDVVTLQGGVWTHVAPSGVESASNLGAGSGIFSSKVGTDFQFKSLVAGTNITLTPSGTDITISTSVTGIFTAQFTSANQAIVPAGALTLAHSLGAMPTLVQCRLKNTSAELGYSLGDELIIPPGGDDGGKNCGLSTVPDATNIVIRYGNAGGGAGVFQIINKTTGAIATADDTKWVLIVKAWK